MEFMSDFSFSLSQAGEAEREDQNKFPFEMGGRGEQKSGGEDGGRARNGK